MPKLQIHLLAFNEQQHIFKAIESILNQTFTDFSLIIHDNHSKDSTLDICNDFSKRDTRISINSGAINVGVVNAFNKCKTHFDSQYVSFRSANDFLHPNFYFESIGLLDSDVSIGLSYNHGGIFNISPDLSIPAFSQCRIDTRRMTEVESTLEVISKYTFSFPLWGVYRRSILEKCRNYQFHYGGDHVFVAEMSLYGAIASTDNILDFRFEPDHDPQSMCVSRSLAQSEEFVKGINPTSYFFSIKNNLPFIDMLWGHVEMISLTPISDDKKNILINGAILILKNRFGEQMRLESQLAMSIFINNIELLESYAIEITPNIYIWLTKVKMELEKFRMFKLLDINVISKMESRVYKILDRY